MTQTFSVNNNLIMSSTQETWLWIGVFGMALGAILIAALGHRLGKDAHHAVASFFVCAIAACLYLLMALGQGDVIVTQRELALTAIGVVDIVNAKLVYFARYVDWVITTPLLLIGLVGVGMKAQTDGEARRSAGGILGAAIGADVLMIVTGLFGALSIDENNKYTWFVVSCIFFLIVLAIIWGPVRRMAQAQGDATAALYNRLLLVLTVLWLIYPVLWILGTEGTASISLNAEVIVFTIIDLSAKVGFGLLLVLGLKKMASPATQETAA
jgi:bacteriorhodopsin